jgi:hypothetical protein
MESRINNIDDLRLEIKRLKAIGKIQEEELKLELKEWQKKLSIVGKLIGFVSPFNTKSKNSILFKDTGITATSLLVLERLFLKDAGLITKIITGLLFTKLASNVSKDDIKSFFVKVVDWFNPEKRKKEKKHKDKERDKGKDSFSDKGKDSTE